MNREEEIDLIKRLISHPAGFDLGLFTLLTIRSHSDGFEVAWGEVFEMNAGIGPYKDFVDLQEAVEFFVDKRQELQLGLDIEAKLMKEKSNE